MGYVGNIPAEKYSSLTQQTFSSPTGTSFTLSQSVTNSVDIALFIDNVRQDPSSYTASGTALTTSTISSPSTMYCLYNGKTTETVSPPAGSVDSSQLVSGSVDDSHISGLAASKLTGVIAPANLGTGTASSSTFLNGAGAYAAAGGGAWAVIANTTVTSTASIAFTGFDASTYDSYQLRICNIQPANNAVNLDLKTSTDGGSSYDSGASDYHHNWMQMRTNTQDNDHDAADSQIKLTGNQGCGSAANRLVSAVIDISNPAEAAYTTFSWQTAWTSGTPDYCVINGFGERMSAADVDAIQLSFSSGNFAAKGKIQLLGIKKS